MGTLFLSNDLLFKGFFFYKMMDVLGLSLDSQGALKSKYFSRLLRTATNLGYIHFESNVSKQRMREKQVHVTAKRRYNKQVQLFRQFCRVRFIWNLPAGNLGMPLQQPDRGNLKKHLNPANQKPWRAISFFPSVIPNQPKPFFTTFFFFKCGLHL